MMMNITMINAKRTAGKTSDDLKPKFSADKPITAGIEAMPMLAQAMITEKTVPEFLV